MTKNSLSLQEKIILGGIHNHEEQYLSDKGFFTKRTLSFFDAWKAYYYFLPFIFPVILTVTFIIVNNETLLMSNELLTVLGVFSLIAIYPTFRLISTQLLYIIVGKIFFTEKGVIVFGKNYKSIAQVKHFLWDTKSIYKTKNFSPRVFQVKDRYNSAEKYKILYTLPIIFFVGSITFLWLNGGNKGLLLFICVLVLFGIPTLSFFLRQLVERFHPLYAFGNLGEKIQKLTPEIESQSKLIQSEFQRDQNFSILRSGFEKLSTTFSAIVALVIKLEGIEKKANKGNLFDSAKYIGSLRADVVTPLVELEKFLESQRKQLLASQKELSRVRVGGDDSLEGNKELQSNRSEELLGELDANIAKLGEMVGKMG